MELNEYQIKAAKTDLNPNTREGLLISLLGDFRRSRRVTKYLQEAPP